MRLNRAHSQVRLLISECVEFGEAFIDIALDTKSTSSNFHLTS
jgi:hypothetical protein